MKKIINKTKASLLLLALLCGGALFAQQNTDPALKDAKPQTVKPANNKLQVDPAAPATPAARQAQVNASEDKALKAKAAPIPAAGSPKVSPHPVVAPKGKEAANSKPAPVHKVHGGPTAVSKPTGAEAVHAKPTPTPARHSGPVKVAPAKSNEKSNQTK